jgi:hypothetical protein
VLDMVNICLGSPLWLDWPVYILHQTDLTHYLDCFLHGHYSRRDCSKPEWYSIWSSHGSRRNHR